MRYDRGSQNQDLHGRLRTIAAPRAAAAATAQCRVTKNWDRTWAPQAQTKNKNEVTETGTETGTEMWTEIFWWWTEMWTEMCW